MTHGAGRRLGAAPVTLAMVMALSGCGRAPPPPPPGHDLSGEYTVHGLYPAPGGVRRTGQPCRAADVGYPEIGPGTPVTVTDAGGGVLGTSTLGPGTLRVDNLRTQHCVHRFALTVPDAAVYRIEVNDRGTVEFGRADLERTGWRAGLSIGNLAPGI
jgi:hypothetical protein